MKSIIQTDTDHCYICGTTRDLETHHVFFGIANRKLSDRDGLTVRLCHKCHHLKAHKASTQEAEDLHVAGQKAWEEHYGPALELVGRDPRQAFIERYGKNWL